MYTSLCTITTLYFWPREVYVLGCDSIKHLYMHYRNKRPNFQHVVHDFVIPQSKLISNSKLQLLATLKEKCSLNVSLEFIGVYKSWTELTRTRGSLWTHHSREVEIISYLETTWRWHHLLYYQTQTAARIGDFLKSLKKKDAFFLFKRKYTTINNIVPAIKENTDIPQLSRSWGEAKEKILTYWEWRHCWLRKYLLSIKALREEGRLIYNLHETWLNQW